MDNDLQKVRHSLAHLLASAVMEFWPKAKLGIGPAIENGFYYDIQFPTPPNQEDLQKLENRMKEFIRENQKFVGKKVSKITAKKLFKNQPYKLDLIKDLKGATVGTYQNGNFLDLCKGGHVSNTKEIDPNAFKLTKLAGAYWKGDEKNDMLTRVYGMAFASAKELQEYVTMTQEAEKRDHRVLGQKLDLFLFSELVGSGLPLFTPKGTLVRDLLDEYVWQLRKTKGYVRVDIPHITKKALYEMSGHWDKFKDELFKITTREKHEFAMKPMNCPHHIQIFARKSWSYRELPQRYSSTTKVYRDEQTGELFGLTRVRSITQDDSHVFCKLDDVEQEINSIWDIINTFYGTFGFTLKVRLSLRDSKIQKNESWDKAEKILRDIIKTRNLPNSEAQGEAAFYGPKIDFIASDSLGREWQVATIQLDFVQPKNFDLSYILPSGQKEQVVMIHSAIMGSIERFMATLLEHSSGNLLVWLCPVQVAIIPISEKHLEYANTIAKTCMDSELRITVYDANETLGKKIREAELQKIPYVIVMGDKELQAHTVSVRARGQKDAGSMKVDEFLQNVKKEITDKK